MEIKYIVRDREAGNIIDGFGTYIEAENALKKYEEEDKENGCFSLDFYEVVEWDSVKMNYAQTTREFWET